MAATPVPPAGADSSGFAGQQRPEDASSEYNVFWFQLRQALGQLSIATYAKVLAVTGGGIAAAPTVDVQPLVNLLDGKGNQSIRGVIHGLPVFRLQGGLNAVICDPIVGDIGKIVACDRDISAVTKNRAQANPGSFRRFSLSDGTFFPCVLGLQPNQYIIFKTDGITAADKNGNTIVMNGTGITITDFSGNKITMSGAGLVLTDKSGNKVDLTSGAGQITVNTHTLTLHTHTDPQGGSTGTPTG